jgi:Fe-S-cluster containining protein
VRTHLLSRSAGGLFQRADNSYKARQKPCPFLGDDDRCTIYEMRPTVCREYPHTDKEGFTFRTMGVASNALVCPAVFWIVEQMKTRVLD